MNKGKYVLSQVMTYFPWWGYEAAIKKYNDDFHAKNLNYDNHCLHLMLGQMATCKSLKDITLILGPFKNAAYHIGIPTVVYSSSLSKANEVRDYRIFKELVGIVGDNIIRHVGYVSEKKYTVDLRLVEI